MAGQPPCRILVMASGNGSNFQAYAPLPPSSPLATRETANGHLQPHRRRCRGHDPQLQDRAPRREPRKGLRHDAGRAGRYGSSHLSSLGPYPPLTTCPPYPHTRPETCSSRPSGIPWEYFNLISGGFLPKGEKDPEKVADARKRYDAALAEKVLAQEERPELVVLAGWMHVFSAPFLEPLQRAGVRVINLHPALPGMSSTVPIPLL